MFWYVHQPVVNIVCQQFGAGQVAYSGYIRAFSLETTPVRALRLNQNINVVGQKN